MGVQSAVLVAAAEIVAVRYNDVMRAALAA